MNDSKLESSPEIFTGEKPLVYVEDGETIIDLRDRDPERGHDVLNSNSHLAEDIEALHAQRQIGPQIRLIQIGGGSL